MPEAVLDVITGAETTPPATSTGTEVSTAEETKPTGEDQAKDTKSEAVSTDKKEEDVKPDSTGRIPYARFKEVNEKAKEYEGVLTKLKDIGIESPEDAEFIAQQAKRIDNVENLISTDPLGFEKELAKYHPEAQAAIAQNAVTRYLSRRAQDYRAEGNEEMAKALEAEREALTKGEPVRRTEVKAEPDGVLAEKWDMFEEKVVDDVSSRLTGKINEFVTSKGVAFKSDAQKSKFYQRVMEGVADSLDANGNFVKQKDQLQSPALGLTKSQRKDVADLYERYATANGRLDKAILEELAVMNLSPNGKHVPPERREITGSGTSPEGGVTQSVKEKLKTDLYKEGFRGSELTQKYMEGMRKLRLGK